MAICRRATTLTVQTMTIKPNPTKDGDGKPRVLAFFEKPRMTPQGTQDRRAGEQIGGLRGASVCHLLKQLPETDRNPDWPRPGVIPTVIRRWSTF